MSSPAPPPDPIDPRVRLAAERTLLAWVRTSLALVGLGFLVARFGASAGGPGHPSPGDAAGPTLLIGVALVALGVVVNLLSAAGHVRLLRRLAEGDGAPFAGWPLAVLVACILAVVGCGLTAYLLTT